MKQSQMRIDRGAARTYGGLPYAPSAAGADYAILGIPLDARVTHRAGARFGPEAIRRAFCTDAFCPSLGRDAAAALSGVDCGDLPWAGDEAAYPGRIAAAVREILEQGAVPMVLGGDHSVTFPELLAYREHYGPVALLHFDSHTDTWGSDGDAVHHDHSTPFRRAIEYGCIDPARSIQLGMRGDLASREDLAFADRHGFRRLPAIELHRMGPARAAEEVRRCVGDHPVVVTFDIDFVDPAFAPGTGTPVPGGFSARETLRLLRLALRGRNAVGFDLVEVLPDYDPDGTTALLASRILREFIISLACRRAGAAKEGGADV